MDARSKLFLLLVYSISLFFIDSIAGLTLYSILFIVVFKLSKLPLRPVFLTIIPIYVIVSLTVIFNAFNFINNDSTYMIFGVIEISSAGLRRGLFIAIRILLLVWMTLIVCYTTTIKQMTDAIDSFLSPLTNLKVPTYEISTVIAIALRFIPAIYQEFLSLKEAQWARGADFDTGSVLTRISAYSALLTPLVIRMFMRADSLAIAMDSRCFGISAKPTLMTLRDGFGAKRWLAVIACSVLLIATAVIL